MGQEVNNLEKGKEGGRERGRGENREEGRGTGRINQMEEETALKQIAGKDTPSPTMQFI